LHATPPFPVVLDPEPLEHPDRATVHPHRDPYVELAHRPAQKLVQIRVQVEESGRFIELTLGDRKRVQAGLHADLHASSSLG
jgi:hypothetical protein